MTKVEEKKVSILTGGEKYFQTGPALQLKSVKDFINDTEDQLSNKSIQPVKDEKESDRYSNKKNVNPKKPGISDKKSENDLKENFIQLEEIQAPFHLSKTKNILFKTHLGRHLHSFLQRLAYQPF